MQSAICPSLDLLADINSLKAYLHVLLFWLFGTALLQTDKTVWYNESSQTPVIISNNSYAQANHMLHATKWDGNRVKHQNYS